MIMYLKKNSKNNFIIYYNYNNNDIILIDNLSKDTKYIDIIYFAKKIFNCKKLIIDL